MRIGKLSSTPENRTTQGEVCNSLLGFEALFFSKSQLFYLFGTYLERKIVSNTETLSMVVNLRKTINHQHQGKSGVTGVPEERVEPTLWLPRTGF